MNRKILLIIALTLMIIGGLGVVESVMGQSGNTDPYARRLPPIPFASLPSSAPDGRMYYVTDGSATSPCTGSGTGAFATRVNGAWNCSNGGSTLPGGSSGDIQYNNSGAFGGIGSTGTGNVARASSPTFVTPTLGVALVTSINGLTITTSTGTFTLTNLKTFTVSNTLTLAGTDGSTLNVGTGGTLGSNAFTSTAYAPIASPTFTGIPAAPTAAVDTNTTQLATTAYVVGQGYAKLASPTFTGTPTLPTGTIAVTQSAADSSTKVATTAFVTTADNLKANLASPTFTGTVTIPTPFTLGATSVTSTGTQLNYLNAATGTTGTTSTNLVFSTSPTLVTPSLGAALATSINGNTFTTGTYTLTGGASKTLTFNNSLALSGTDSTTITFPTTSATVARTDAGQQFTGVNIFTSPKILTDISDTNGNESIKFTATASAVNEITIANAATGNGPTISATGGDTNIPLTLAPKGTGQALVQGTTNTKFTVKMTGSNNGNNPLFELQDDSGNAIAGYNHGGYGYWFTGNGVMNANGPNFSNTGGWRSHFGVNNLSFSNDGVIKWNASAFLTGSYDTGLARSAAGVVIVTNGSTGSGSIAPQVTATGNLGTTSLGWGQLYFDKTFTTAGTTGAQTINKALFSVNFAAAATSLVVTNSTIAATSGVVCTVNTNDTTLKSVQAVPASGSVTLYGSAAATAETRITCWVAN